MKIQSAARNDVSLSFVAQHDADITAVLQCWDRLRFQANLSLLQRRGGVMMWLYQLGVLLKNFAAWSKACAEDLRAHSLALAQAVGQSAVFYLRDGSARKDELARAQAQARGIKEGLIGVWSALEPCTTYFVRGDRVRHLLRLERGPGKCLHYYFYFLHPQCGLVHVRLQSWLPYTVTVCLNGHDWLARQMDAQGLGYERRGNAFRWLENPAATQALADAQQQCAWPALLDGLLAPCHPLRQLLCEPVDQAYYWTLKESEFSTDLLFRDEAALARLYPQLLHFGMTHFGSREIMRFLGKRVPSEGCPANFHGEAQSSLRARPEGVRIKHFVAGNSVKMYDKEGCILRVETTINRPREFRVLRESANRPTDPPKLRPMRKGLADLQRRAAVSQAANERCLEAYAAVPLPRRTGEVADTIFRAVEEDGRRYRALQPWSPKDGPLLDLLNDGAWLLNGLRNCDLRARLFPGEHTPEEDRRLAARVSRLLRLVRAHQLIEKMPKSHRYQLTTRGREIITALQTARRTNLDALLKAA
jgi:hypothetical protein